MHPYQLWNTIGASFDATREQPWKAVVDWLEVLPPERRILDLMGGNGRHARAAQDRGHRVVVADWSLPLARAAARATPSSRADATRLPFADASFDAALYVAGLHGLPEPEDRTRTLQEMHRTLRPQSPALVTVWSRNAPRFRDGPEDVVVPWRRDGAEVPRTYHLYTPDALHAALEESGFEVTKCVDVPVGDELNVFAEIVRP